MKIKIASRFFQSSVSKYNLVELAQYMASFYFNARTVHFNTSGKNFLEIHKYAQELYEQAEDFYDDLVETALSFNEKVQPMFVTPGNFEMLKQETFAPEQAVEKLSDNVKRLFDIFESANKEEYPSFVYSKLDSIMEWLDKQNYKLEQMRKSEGIQSSRKAVKSSLPGENQRDEYLKMVGRNNRENQLTLSQGEFDDAMDSNGNFIRGFYKWSSDSHNWVCEIDDGIYLVVSYATDGGSVRLSIVDKNGGKGKIVAKSYVQFLNYDEVAKECVALANSVGVDASEFFE